MKETCIIPYNFQDSDEEYIIPNYKWKSKLGAKLHRQPEIASWKFRFAYFTFGFSLREGIISRWMKQIPIPFMKNDHGLVLMIR